MGSTGIPWDNLSYTYRFVEHGNKVRLFPLYYAGGVLLMTTEAGESIPDETPHDKEPSQLTWSFKFNFLDFHNRGWTSANTFETLSTRHSPTVITGLAPLTRASKKLEARGTSTEIL